MADDSKGWSRLLDEATKIIPAEMKEMIGVTLGMFLFAALPALVALAGYGVYKFVTAPKQSAPECWKVQAVDGKSMRFNSCTGELLPVPATAPGK